SIRLGMLGVGCAWKMPGNHIMRPSLGKEKAAASVPSGLPSRSTAQSPEAVHKTPAAGNGIDESKVATSARYNSSARASLALLLLQSMTTGTSSRVICDPTAARYVWPASARP